MPVSLTDVAELINFDFTDESRAEFAPIDADDWWIMFANIPESTTIYIRSET